MALLLKCIVSTLEVSTSMTAADGPVLGITLAAYADVDGRREDDMSQNAALQGGPASGNVLVEGVELFGIFCPSATLFATQL
jgi:hypothetical protein